MILTTAAFISMHVDDAVHPPSTHFRSPGFAHAPLHPPPHSALSTVHAWLQCHFPTSYTPAHFHEHAYTAPIHPRHQTSHPPFARTHLALRPRLSTRFSTLPLTLLSVDRRILRSFSVAMATVPALYIHPCSLRARCINLPVSLPPSVGRSEATLVHSSSSSSSSNTVCDRCVLLNHHIHFSLYIVMLGIVPCNGSETGI